MSQAQINQIDALQKQLATGWNVAPFPLNSLRYKTSLRSQLAVELRLKELVSLYSDPEDTTAVGYRGSGHIGLIAISMPF